MKKREIPNRQETASFSPCFWYSSQYGTKNVPFRSFDGKNRAKTASRIPFILGSLEEI
ncbi:MAG: hypothetical protein MUQ00_05490 [Candidatus Aminicenantes bacterium]|nr:hypothetical protein [Candidatus Aminicenantes bacterium]